MGSHPLLYTGFLDEMIMLMIFGPTRHPLSFPNHVLAGTLFELKLCIDISIPFIFIKSTLLC
jgi:hypothetical protein